MKIRNLCWLLTVLLAGCVTGKVSPVAVNETQTQYLSGHGSSDTVLWDFYCTGGRKSGEWTKIHVPSCWEQEGFGSYNYGYELRGRGADQQPGFANEKGLYRYDFTVPADWKDKTVRIVFDGSMTDTDVKINGQSAGTVHQGSFYRFKYDITPLLKFGETNRLEVSVSKESANASVNAAERRGDYWNFGGIFRPVFLEALPRQFIDWTAVDAKADGSFMAQVHLGAGVAAQSTVSAQIVDAQGQSVGAPFSAQVAAGQNAVTLNTNAPGVKLWTAETPNLYHVRFTLAAKGAAEHVVTERFGFRTMEVRSGDGFYLNGQKIILKGICRHSFWPETGRTLDKQICYDDVKLIKDMNMNAVRMSHYPPDHEFLEACDELGLYVLDELGGWHGAYDGPTGKILIGEMVRRDVNHPSILFWDNGNEGGWFTPNDGEFAKWDPQNRKVLHPQSTDHGINDPHYPTFADVVKGVDGPQIFFPTEYLHGIYDGGLGTGLHDYWAVMKQGKAFGGAIFWSLLDEAVVRTDEDGKLDSRGSYAPDGVVGPHREKEGSFYTIKQIWSPVQLSPVEPIGPQVETFPAAAQTSPEELAKMAANAKVVSNNSTPPQSQAQEFPPLPAGWQTVMQSDFWQNNGPLTQNFNGVLRVKNSYDFTNLDQCKFEWSLERFGTRMGETSILAKGEVDGPSVAPHGEGVLQLPLPPSVGIADVLRVSVKDPTGHELWKWSWSMAGNHGENIMGPARAPQVQENNAEIVVSKMGSSVLDLQLHFSKETGLLASVSRNGSIFSLSNGPRFVAAKHIAPANGRAPVGQVTKYQDLSGANNLTSLTWRQDAKFSPTMPDVIVEAKYDGALKDVTWRITSVGLVYLTYTYAFDGAVDLLGVNFDYPETNMKGITWLGWGPYRTWQNRIEGTTLDVWHNTYNDTIPGETWIFPEFKGYFRGWRWAEFQTAEGNFRINSQSLRQSQSPDDSYLGVYTPRDGTVGPLLDLPKTGLAFFDVIPANRDKFKVQEQLGPQSQPKQVSGEHTRTVEFDFRSP